MGYTVWPDEARLLRDFARQHRGNDVLIRQATEGLAILKRTPREHSGRIRKLPDGRYRYRHGRCRIRPWIDEAASTVVVIKMVPRDASTYRGIR